MDCQQEEVVRLTAQFSLVFKTLLLLVPPNHHLWCTIYPLHYNFVCNQQDCNLEEILDDEDPPRSSKDAKKANMLDTGKDASLMFKITHKVAYKNVLKGTLTSIFLTNNMFQNIISKFITCLTFNHHGSSQCCYTEG